MMQCFFKMSSEAVTSQSQSPQTATWTAEKTKQLVDFLVEHYHRGEAEGGSMKKEQWLALSRIIEGMTPEQCKNKWGDFKLKFRQWKELESQSGFGWNHGRELYEASNEVWNGLNKSWRNIVWHKTHVLPYREQLEMVLSKSQATGAHAVSATNAVELIDKRQENPVPNNPRKRHGSTSPEPGHKGKKAKPTTNAAVMAEMTEVMKRSMKEKKDVQLTMKGRAVSLAKSSYRERMSMKDLMSVFELFEDETMAVIFLALDDEEMRDEWLKMKTHVSIREEGDTGLGGVDEEDDLLSI